MSKNRKKYMEEWRKNNREHIREAFREWYGINKDTKPYYKNRRLKNSISESGYYGTSGMGRKYENLAKKLLNGSTLSASFHSSYDIEWNGLSIDVKARNRNIRGYFHFTKKKTCRASHFLCFCIDGGIQHILLIPIDIFKDGIFLSEKSIAGKYSKFQITFEEQ